MFDHSNCVQVMCTPSSAACDCGKALWMTLPSYQEVYCTPKPQGVLQLTLKSLAAFLKVVCTTNGERRIALPTPSAAVAGCVWSTKQ